MGFKQDLFSLLEYFLQDNNKSDLPEAECLDDETLLSLAGVSNTAGVTKPCAVIRVRWKTKRRIISPPVLYYN